MPTFTPEQMRRLLAEDYARKAKAGDDVARLFEFALEEGWLAGVAVGIELAMDREDTATVEKLRAIVAAAKRPELPRRS